MEQFLIRGWEHIFPGVRCLLYTVPSQTAIGQWDWGFHTLRGGFDPGDHRFRPQVVGVVRVWKYILLIRGWEHILPGVRCLSCTIPRQSDIDQ